MKGATHFGVAHLQARGLAAPRDLGTIAGQRRHRTRGKGGDLREDSPGGDVEGQRPVRTAEERGGVRIVPNTLHAYDVNSSILVYFEIYHLTLSPAGRTQFTLNLITERIPDTESITSKIRNLFRKKSSARVVTSYDYQGEVQNEVFYHDIQLEENREGRYRLTIQVEDRLSGNSI